MTEGEVKFLLGLGLVLCYVEGPVRGLVESQKNKEEFKFKEFHL